MACPRVCVVDTSASVRETIGIILAADCDVVCLAPSDVARLTDEAETADLFIVEAGTLAVNIVPRILKRAAVVWLGSHKSGYPEAGGAPSLSRSFTPGELKDAVTRA
ncbi:MAG TPA: hypothetical protein VMT89_06595, partial [Candidatus Acidoferrales bacterium]|nr:hypothetical protein [Candidatus Acidoferrales bacterium]